LDEDAIAFTAGVRQNGTIGMKPRTTLLLLAIAIALAAFIFTLDRFSQNTRERQERSAHVVEVNRTDIDGLTIHNGDGFIKVKAEGDGWKMVAPWQDDADAGVIDQLLDAIQNLRPEDVITDLGKGDKKRQILKDFGLNKSKIRLKLDGKRMPAELEFGQDTAVPGRGYLRIADDDAVYVVNNDLKNIVSKTPENFRDHRMTPFLTTLINRVVFQVSGGEIELAKVQDNWQLVRPIKARASNDAVVEILTKMNQIQISRFVPENKSNPGSFGLDIPADILTLYGEGKKFKIEIGSAVPSDPQTVYAGLPDRNTVVEVNKGFASLFNITPNDLRDRKIARLNSDLVDRVTIENADQPKIVLSREENRWRFLSPSSAPANANNVNRLIQEINDDEVTEFVSDTATDLVKYGLEQPKLKITFSSYSSENTAESNAGEVVLSTLEFGNSEQGVTYGRLKEEPYIFSIADQLLDDMPKVKFSFRSLDILDLNRDELVSVQVKKTGEEPVDLIRGAKGKWILKAQQNRQDEGRMQVFLTALTGLRAAAWAGDPSPAFGLDQPSLEIKISYQSGEQKRQAEIRFGKANPGDQHYGMCTEEEGVFLVGDEQFNQLQALVKR
jgi:hypothetical protein